MLGSGRVAKWCISACLCVLVASCIAPVVQPHKWSAAQFATLSDGGIRSDGWLQEEAKVDIEGFISRGNYLEFVFNPWRPSGVPTAQVAVSVCAEPEQVLTITNREPVRVALRGDCQPKTVSLRGLNTFVPPQEREGRPLSVQIQSVSVSSRLGIPLVELSKVAGIAALLAVLMVCASGAWGRSRLAHSLGCGVVIIAAGVALLSEASAQKLFPLWVFCAALLGGMWFWRWTTEKDGGEAKGSHWDLCSWWWLSVPLFLGSALRVYGITFGLPWNYHPDEVPKVNAIMRMYEQGTWNPQYFLHPSLLLYATYGCNVVLQTLGIEGSFRDTAYLAGRVVSLIAGTGSIALTYFVGRRLFSASVGFSAALLLAVFPLHVTCSRYLKEDSLLTFVALACVAVTVLAVQSNRKWMLIASGLLAGATAGTKYSGILMVVVPLSAPWLASRRILPDPGWLPWAVLAACVAPIGFLTTTPFAWWDYAKFAKDFGSESRHMQMGHTTSIDPWSQLWMYHFWRSLVPGMTIVAAIGGVFGAGLLLRRGRIEDLFLLGLIALFYLPAEYVKAKPAPQPERYVTPCLPFLAIAFAELLRLLRERTVLREWGAGRGAGFAAVLGVAICLPLLRVISLSQEVPNDTRDQMARWMEENIPPGSTVLMDWKPYCPRFEEGKFNIVYIPRARIIPELDTKALKASGGQYLVLSSLFYGRYFTQPESNPVLRQRIREVFERVPVVKQFAPRAGTYGFHNPVVTLFSLQPHDFARLDEERQQLKRGEVPFTSNQVRASIRW